MINEETRAAIKGYLEGFIQGLIEQHRSGIRRAMVREAHAVNSSSRGILKPFHEAIPHSRNVPVLLPCKLML